MLAIIIVVVVVVSFSSASPLCWRESGGSKGPGTYDIGFAIRMFHIRPM